MVGLDISDRSIKVVEIEDGGGRQLKTICWSPLSAQYMRRGIVQDPQAAAEAVRAALTKCSPVPVSGKAVVMSIPEMQSFLRVVELPVMKEEEMNEAVRWAIRQHIPFDLERVYVDWQPLTAPVAPGGKRKVLVGAAQVSVVDPLLKVADILGLRVVGLELEAQAIVRSLLPPRALDVMGVLMVDLGGASTNVIFFDRGSLRFTASIQSGGDAVTRQLAEKTGLTLEQAAQKKAIVGMRGAGADAQMSAALREVLTNLTRQIEQTVRAVAFQMQVEEPVRTLLLSGGAANIPGLEELFAEIFPNIPIQLGNSLINVSLENDSVAGRLSPTDASHFTTAIGLALRQENSGREINLLPPGRRRLLRRDSVMDAIVGFLRMIMIGLGVILVSGAVTLGVLWGAGRLSEYEESQRQISEAVGQYQDFRDVIGEKNAVLSHLTAVGDSRVVWSDKVREVIVSLPRGVTLGGLAGRTQHTDGVVEEATLAVSGIAPTRTVLGAIEQSLADIEGVEQVTGSLENLLSATRIPYAFNIEYAIR